MENTSGCGGGCITREICVWNHIVPEVHLGSTEVLELFYGYNVTLYGHSVVFLTVFVVQTTHSCFPV